MSINSLMIVVTGPDKSGKGYVIASIAHCLEHLGCEVIVQGAETHNAPKLAKTDEELIARLKGQKIVIIEQQT